MTQQQSTAAGRLLIVDDENDLTMVLCATLRMQGYEATGRTSGGEALEALKEQEFDLLLTDLIMPGMSGIELVRAAIDIDPNLVCIIMTGQGTVQTAVEAMKSGAFDYILKPFKPDQLLVTLSRAMEVRRLRLENVQLQEALYKRLQEMEEKYRSIFENAFEGIFQTTPDGKIFSANPALARMFGFDSPDQAMEEIGDVQQLYVNPGDRDRFRQLLEEQGFEGTLETDLRRKDGTVMTVKAKVRAVRDRAGAARCFEGTVEDITARKEAEEALRKSEEQYRRIVNTANEGIAVINENFRLTFMNARFAEMLGYNQEELLGADHIVFAFEEDIPVFLERRKQCKQGISQRFERRFRRKDGSTLWVHNSTAPLMDESGKFLGAYFMHTDITQWKEAEEAVRRSEEIMTQTLEKLRRSLIDTFQVMSMTVEVRDPYTAGHQRKVSNLARLIAQEMDLPGDTVENIRMAGIVHDIGKLSVPAEILSKPGKLSDIEVSIIKVHPKSGYNILKNVELPYPIAETVLQHHERLNGSGYPQGLKDGQILPEACIVAVADVVEAIASHRPYRPALGIESALEEIEQNKSILYDAKVVDVCLRLFREKGFKFE